jgi:DNA-binding transcriptional LysR family regulator
MDYSLSEIRAYNAIVKCGNFSRAAEKLNVSQPAVTAQIRKLESRFEYPLLERFSKGVIPTELGKRLYHLSCQYEDLDKAIDVLGCKLRWLK